MALEFAEDHPDPRMRKLGQELADVSNRMRDVDNWPGGRMRAGTDLDRFRAHSRMHQLAKEKIFVLEAMQAVDRSFNAIAVSSEIESMRSLAQRSKESAHEYNPAG